MLSGYATLLILFGAVTASGSELTAKDAYDMLEGPLLALIGGSLAIAKDLTDDDPGVGNVSESNDE